MSFISLQFLLFLGVAVFLYYICPKKIQWLFLLLASYAFYFFSGITPLLFVVSSTILVYLCGIWMRHVIATHKKKSEAKKVNKRILLLAVFIEFGILLTLKYYNFIAHYDASERYAFGAPVVEEKHDLIFDNENQVANNTYIILLNDIEFADVRNRNFVV